MLNLSYSLFTNKSFHGNRTYDANNGFVNRYWFNLPALIIANSIFYKDALTVFHISRDLVSHHLYPFLDNITKSYSKFEVRPIDYSYHNTEPTLWRFIPLWAFEDVDLLSRDIDSIPNEAEYRSTKAFLDSSYIVHNIRSHPQHSSYLTKILAGLCGFKKECRIHLAHNYDQFYKMADYKWGCDQSILMHYWVDRVGIGFVKNCFLDSPISCIGPVEENIYGFDAGKLPKEDYEKVDISHIENIQFFNKLTSWCGEPIDARGDATKYLINLDSECARAVKFSLTDAAKSFYGV